MGFSTLSLKGKALQCLAQREHSRAELQEKLRRHAANALRKAQQTAPSDAAPDDAGAQTQADIKRTLDDLAAAGLQSDTRAAQSIARSKSPRYGVHRLKQHLQAKGLEAGLIAQTVGQARLTELERAQDIWRRRFGEPATDMAERARQVRFLSARGFDADVVRRVVRGVDEVD